MPIVSRGTKAGSKSTGSRRRVDWCRYTDFRSRRSQDDLAKLCSRYSKTKLDEIFSTFDERGLCPIHWAAVHNRSDLIRCMAEQGSSIRTKCNNLLFSNGTSLHLAAMNGGIEAAASLLDICPPDQVKDWLNERDSEGQTALMRTAAPRSKRLDTVRDLLQKNLWSLNGRPAETALFLINKGSGCRETDELHGMNLLHLAIVNDYDDIVYLLLSIDRSLISVKAQIDPIRTNPTPIPSPSTSSKTSLISERDRANKLVTSGLRPLQLAILYSRVTIIKFLWYTERIELQHSAMSKSSEGPIMAKGDLRQAIDRAFWLNKIQLKRTIKSLTLKTGLALDISLTTLVWIPVYLGAQDNEGHSVLHTVQGGFFLAFFCLTLALATRIIFKVPGYLKRNTQEYMDELDKLTKQSNAARVTEADETGSVRKNVEHLALTAAPAVEERVRLLCHRCRCIRRPRTKHCNYCGRCIKDFDHHCIYLSSCIGRGNRLDFLFLMVMIFITATYGTALFLTQRSFTSRGFWHFVAFTSIAKYTLIGGVASFQNLRRACQGVTLYESIRGERIRRVFGSGGPPEAISRSHRIYATHKNSFWRYPHDRFLLGDMPIQHLWTNFKEFANGFSCALYPMSSIKLSDIA